MWVITTRGFFSAVQHRRDPNRVLVRARCEEDIRNLEDLIDASPWRLRRSDYEWRLECSVAEWTTALASMSMEIDYDNFKNAVKKRQGDERASVYMRVWSALLKIERPGRWKSWSGKLFSHSDEQLGVYETLCDCWHGADEGDVIDHDIACPYALELEATS